MLNERNVSRFWNSVGQDAARFDYIKISSDKRNSSQKQAVKIVVTTGWGGGGGS